MRLAFHVFIVFNGRSEVEIGKNISAHLLGTRRGDCAVDDKFDSGDGDG